MCGICVVVTFYRDSQEQNLCKCPSISEESLERLKRRGPDCSENKTVQFNDKTTLSFFASVLHLRGTTLTRQPYSENENLLLWNGEIFGGNLAPTEKESDTRYLSSLLLKSSDPCNILDTFGGIHGPWAFIYWQKQKGLLWFGRDIFGRRSLLWSECTSPSLSFSLSSVALGSSKWTEVPANGIYCLDVSETEKNNSFAIRLYRWSKSAAGQPFKCSPDALLVDSLLCQTTTAELEILSPIEEPMNTSQVSQIICDKIHNSSEITDLRELPVEESSPGAIFKYLLETDGMETIVSEFECVLSNAVEGRIRNQLFICKNCFQPGKCIQNENKCLHSSVGILFSGGIDSMVIAALAQRHIPIDVSIDLINVAFNCHKPSQDKRKRKPKDINHIPGPNYNTPDRITGRHGVKELQSLFPLRIWNFVEVNVTQDQLECMRSQHICHLIKPACTVLDDSIGCACWFAAKGEGVLDTSDGPQEYLSPSRVLLLGMGADEQLAGYSRHRAKYNLTGWNGVIDELTLELNRISSRNLGRDDRISSDHGREARFPFLDENVVSFLNGLPVNIKADFKYPRGVGEKLLLRLLAYKLGLTKAASIPKRAIQFGSRIARAENCREKGSDVCSRLCAETST